MNCIDCDGTDIKETIETQVFQYGADPNGVDLSAVVPVLTCQGCQSQWTDWRGEDARTAAVDAHKGKHS